MLTASSIKSASENSKNLKFVRKLAKELLGIGTDVWAVVSALELEPDSKPFFEAVREFC